MERHRRRHEDAVNSLLGRYPLPDIEYRIHLPREKPETAIKRIAEEQDIDLIVMGTHARSSIPKLIVGTPFEAVMNAVTCGRRPARRLTAAQPGAHAPGTQLRITKTVKTGGERD